MSITVTEYGYLEGPYLDEPYMSQQVGASMPAQANRSIDVLQSTKFQVLLNIEAISSVKTQVNRLLVANNYPALTQTELRIEDSENVRTQISRRIDTGLASIQTQINRMIDSGLNNIRTQVEKRVDTGSSSAKTQIDRRISSGSGLANSNIQN